MVSVENYQHFLHFLGNIFFKLSDVHTRVLRNTKCNLAVSKMRAAYGQKSFALCGLGNEISAFDPVIQNEAKSVELRIFKESCSTSKQSSLFLISLFFGFLLGQLESPHLISL